MAGLPDYFGKFPFAPTEKRPTVIGRKEQKRFVYPLHDLHNSDLNHVFASTDRLFCGIYELPPGGTFDPPDIHAGDEQYYVLQGQLTILNPETGQVVDLWKGESLLIPKGVWHKAYNFEHQVLRILFLIAPKPWDEEGSPEAFPGKPRIRESE